MDTKYCITKQGSNTKPLQPTTTDPLLEPSILIIRESVLHSYYIQLQSIIFCGLGMMVCF